MDELFNDWTECVLWDGKYSRGSVVFNDDGSVDLYNEAKILGGDETCSYLSAEQVDRIAAISRAMRGLP
jgi:hypothetical protein